MTTSNVKDTLGAARAASENRLQAAACDASDLMRIMAHLAEQIADADRRHSDALANMQKRLGMLGDATGEMRDQVPMEMSGVLDRIEESMAHLADKIAADSPERTPGMRSVDPTRVIAAETERAPVLRSALAAESLNIYARGKHIGQSRSGDVVDNLDVFYSSPAGGYSHNLDSEAADLLARLYDETTSDPDGAPALDAVTSSAPTDRDADPALNSGGTTAADASIESAAATAKSDAPTDGSAAQAEGLEGQRSWLESRLGEVAQRIEQSIAGLDRGDTLEALDERFLKFEERLTQAMAGSAKSVDLETLKSIESQVEDLNAQFISVQTHFSRLDTIELELRSLAERLTGEEFGKLLSHSALKATDAELASSAAMSRFEQQLPKIELALQSIASQLSADKIANLVAQSKPSAPDASAIAMLVADHVSQRLPSHKTGHTDAADHFDELKASLETFAAEQRHGDAQINTMLDTMQQAMIRLLDRMDAIEQVRYSDHEQIEDQHAVYGDANGAPSRMLDDAEPPQPHQAQHFQRNEMPPAAPAPVNNGIPVHSREPAQNVEVETQPVVPATNASGLRASVQQMPPEETQPSHSAGSSREDFIAAARRAARMAAEAPVETAPASDNSPQDKRKRAAAKDVASTSMLSPVAMALICLLLVGVSFIAVKTTLLAPPSAPHPAVQSNAPAAAPLPIERSTADKRIQNLEDADGSLSGDRARRSPDGTGAPGPRRSSLQGESGSDDRDLIGQGSFPATEGGRQSAGLPTVPAALSKEGPSAVAPARSTELPPIGIGPNSLRTAAAKGDASAEFEVGARFAEGRGVTQDLQQAVIWYTRAASQGFAAAQYRLGSMFERGLGVKADLARARVWYQRAAEQGIVKAMHNLAVLSAGRDNSTTDYLSAGKWFRAAADHGLTDSQFNLAIMYDSGLGMERDTKQAFKWFSLAARAGDEEGARRRESLRQKLLPQEVADVEAEIGGWRPKSVDQNVNDPRLAGEAWKNRAR